MSGVSYLVSLYNKSAYIAATLAAIATELAQTGGEIVVYDDASTDDSLARLQASPHAKLVRLVRGERNGGCVLAASRLIAEARFPLVRFVDADDQLRPGSTAAMAAALTAGGFDFLYGQITPQDQAPPPCPGPWPAHALRAPLRAILRQTDFNPSTMLVRTTALQAVAPLACRRRHAQDFQIGLRLAARGARIGWVGQVVALSPAETEGRLSGRMAEMFGEMAGFVADEARHGTLPTAALRFAARRYTARYLRYARRAAVIRPGWGQCLRLWLGRQLVPLAGRGFALAQLERVAAAFLLDRATIRPAPRPAKARLC
ncbi:glycosyltransferase [Acidocella sp.]|uniref:glycosyltransferase family 2 protein n=1 Tax=Acidocella sp. TaxID=50710 RepID=UPI002605CB35|nr:glycosyltransferase [Acidocella sp.]